MDFFSPNLREICRLETSVEPSQTATEDAPFAIWTEGPTHRRGKNDLRVCGMNHDPGETLQLAGLKPCAT